MAARSSRKESLTFELPDFGKRFWRAKSALLSNKFVLLFCLIIFLSNIAFYYYPVWKYGYAFGNVDAEDHSFSIKLSSFDPQLFLRSLVSFRPICSPYHIAVCRVFAVSDSPPIFYLAGAAVNLLPVLDINVGYLTACIFVSLASVAVFLISFRLTKNLILSFFSTLAFSLSLMLFQMLHQGLFIAEAGPLFFFASLYFLYDSFRSFRFAPLILSLFLLAMTSSYYLAPFLVSLIAFVLLLSISDRKRLAKYLGSSLDYLSSRKYWIVLLAVAGFYIFRSFVSFSPLVSSSSLVPYDQTANALFDVSVATFLNISPPYLSFVLVAAVLLSAYSASILVRKKKVDEYSFFFMLSAAALVLLPLFLNLRLTEFVNEHVIKMLTLLPFLYIFTLVFSFHLVSQRLPKKYAFVVCALIFVALLLSIDTAKAWGFMNLKNFYMDDLKYAAIRFVQTQTPANSTVFFAYQNLGFKSFVLRRSFDAYTVFPSNTTNLGFDTLGLFDYVVTSSDYKIQTMDASWPGTVVFQNPEIQIYKINK